MATSSKPQLFALLRAAGSLAAEVESRLSGAGLSLPKLAALHQLVTAGDSLPLGHLADRLSCVRSNVTQLIDRLEADGFVERAPDPEDRRSKLAVITPAGRRAYERGIQIQQQAERELFGVLTAAESNQLHELISKLDRHCRSDTSPAGNT